MLMKTPKTLWYLLFLMLFIASCGDEKPKPVDVSRQANLDESLEKANRYLVNEEEEEIQNYISRHHYQPVATGTGLRYQVLHQGQGDTIAEGQLVTLEYELKNIMGDVIYNSENEGAKSFVVGHGDVESGLDEAVRHLRQGDVAVVIIPSHLGYGLHGDQKDIPGCSTLVYMLKVVDVK